MTRAIHLVQLRLDAQRLYSFAKRMRVAPRDLDEGYAIHAVFAGLFDHNAPMGERVAPKPFHIVNAGGREIKVLGYSSVDHHALAKRAESFADPDAWGVCAMDAMASKPMPTTFEAGAPFGFSVRVCPVRRIAKRGPMNREHAEVDAFLAEAWKVGSEVKIDRELVYRDWLTTQLARENAARIVTAHMTSFRRSRLFRRGGDEPRAGHRTERPDVIFDGVLEVGEPAAFAELLARGVGRHRAFGFGMMLLMVPEIWPPPGE